MSTRAERRRNPTPRILALSGLLAGLGIALLLGVIPRLPSPAGGIRTPWPLLAIGFAIAESFAVHFEFKQDAHSFSLCELPLVIGLAFGSPHGVVLARVTGGLAGIALVRRQNPLKIAFNVSLFAVESTAAVAIYGAIAALGGPMLGVRWGAAFAATLTVNVLATLAISTVIALATGSRDNSALKRTMLVGSVTAAGTTALALITVELMRSSMVSLALVGVVAAILFVGYRGYASLYQRNANLQRLYEFTGALARSSELESSVRSALLSAGELMRAKTAELYLLDAHGEAMCLGTAADGRLEATPVAGDTRRDWVWSRVTGEGRAVVLPQSSREPEAREYLASHGYKDLMMAPLVHGGQVIGALAVRDRLSEVSSFGEEDRKIFETLTNHASISIQNSRLIDQLRDEVAAKRHQAFHDMLTGLGNRRLFAERTQEALVEAEPDGSSVAVLLLDLNRFKDVNDSLGHHCGDVLLREVGRRLVRAIPAPATVCRLGGDEFAVLLPRIDSAAQAVRVAATVRAALDPPFEVQDLSLAVGAAIGIAISPEHGRDASTLLRHADVAMYQAKDSHELEVYDPMRDRASARNLALALELREAIEQGRLQVYFQPKADCRTGEPTGAEALSRWWRPDGTAVPPEEFIPLAESVGLMRSLTMFVLRRSMEQACRWRDRGNPIRVAVNLSARSVMDIQLPGEVAALLRETGLDPRQLILEITESQVVSDPPRTIRVLEELSALGVQLAIDDFGTGYSSLSYLQRLPVHEIKIDKSFVTNMLEDSGNASIVKTVIELGRSLGLRVVAEGVEDRATWDAIAEAGCDLGQGFFLSRPLPPAEFETWLTARLASPRRWGNLSVLSASGNK